MDNALERLSQSLKSGLISTDMFTKLVNALVSKKIISKAGKPTDNRESSLAYLGVILPIMDSFEMEILELEPELFIKRFLFAPSEKRMSLATFLQGRGVLDEYFNLITLDWFTSYC